MTVSSPCIRICILDEPSGLCLGCGRTRAEIAGWMGMSEETRRTVMAGLPDRLEALRAADDATPRPVTAGD